MYSYTTVEVTFTPPTLATAVEIGIPTQTFETEALLTLSASQNCLQLFSPWVNKIMWLPRTWECL